jgi:hypothetical protein
MQELSSFPEDSKVWIFPLFAAVDAERRGRLLATVSDFVRQWTAHGTAVRGAATIVEDRVLIIVADAAAAPSGCSIDRLFAMLEVAGNQIGASLLDSSRLLFRTSAGEWVEVQRGEIRNAVETSRIAADSQLVDTSVSSLADVRSGAWLRPAIESFSSSFRAAQHAG